MERGTHCQAQRRNAKTEDLTSTPTQTLDTHRHRCLFQRTRFHANSANNKTDGLRDQRGSWANGTAMFEVAGDWMSDTLDSRTKTARPASPELRSTGKPAGGARRTVDLRHPLRPLVVFFALILATSELLRAAGEETLWGPTIDDRVITEDSYQCYYGGLKRYARGADFCRRRFTPHILPRERAEKNFGTDPISLSLDENLCDCMQWYKITEAGDDVFPERNGHATTTFNGRLWLTGGRSKEYSRWDLERSQRRADVWSSVNGREWVQEKQLLGDFHEQNAGVLIPGPVAPWWERFGHTLDNFHAEQRNADESLNRTLDEVMVLFGGYAPNPMNDMWVTTDGTTWNKVFKEPYYDTLYGKWPTPRAYHASAVFQGAFWVMGGSPLNNHVWSARNLTLSPLLPAGAVDTGQRVWWTVKWTKHFSSQTIGSYELTSVPWMPRAGLMSASQPVFEYKTFKGARVGGDEDSRHEAADGHGLYNVSMYKEYLYVMGGFAAWHQDDLRYDGERARNDVWRTEDGTNWTRMDTLSQTRGLADLDYVETPVGGAPWAARAFGSLVTWSMESGGESRYRYPGNSEPYHDVTETAYKDASYMYYTNKGLPRYSERVDEMNFMMTPLPRSYNDHLLRVQQSKQLRTRWMKEGMYWAPRIWLSGGGFFGREENQDVSVMEGYSDMWWTRDGVDWYQVNKFEGVEDTLYSSCESFYTEGTAAPKYIGKYGHTLQPFQPADSYIPAMFFLAGDMVDDGGLLSDVFVSSNGILCDINDRPQLAADGSLRGGLGFETCSGHGVCAKILPYSRTRAPFSFEEGDVTFENATLWLRGCQCDAGYTGEYCEGIDPDYYSSATQLTVNWIMASSTVALVVHFARDL